jgi:hypothetical protein
MIKIDNFNRSRITFCLCLLIILGLIFRFFYPFFSNPLEHIYSDAARHYYNSFSSNFGHKLESFIDPVLPQLELMAVYSVFGNSVLGLAAYFGLLSTIMPWFWYRWAREVFPTKLQALTFMALIVFLPSWIGIYSFTQDETLLLPMLGASLWLSWRAKRKQTAPSIMLASLFWALTICVKMNTLFEAIIIITWLMGSYLYQNQPALKKALVVFGSLLLIACAYFSQAVWSYYGLGVACLFPPAFGANNKAGYLSGALEESETFISNGKVKMSTGFYCSNANLVHSLSPFSEWATWRKGQWETYIDCDKKLYITLPVAEISIKKRILLLIESIVHYFLSPSWPDDRSDDFVQNIQVQMRWLWPLLDLAVIFLAFKKNRIKNILVILTVGCSLAYACNQTFIVEGRYRKPWEGIAIAAFIYLCVVSKSNSQFKIKPNQN